MKGDLFASGILTGHDMKTGQLSESPQAQAEVAFERLHAALDAVGAHPDNVAHMFCWYQDHSVRDTINGPFKKLFPTLGDRPNRHSVIRKLPAGQALQVEAMGTKGATRANLTLHGVAHGGIDGLINSLPLGIRIGNLLYSAGTYGSNPETGITPASPEEQAEFAFLNTERLLDAAGMTMDDIGHMLVWFKDPKYRDAVNGPWVKYFPNIEDRPARHAITADLPGEMVIQLEIIAVKE